MFTFLRKIRRHSLAQAESDTVGISLIESGSARKYIIYATGEILLVMIGILLALQVNNWNEGRKDRMKEKEILLEIRENVHQNSIRLQQEIEEEESVVQSINYILFNLNHQKVYHDSLDFHFLNAGYWPALVIKTSGYETLKSRGIELIRSTELKQAIIDLYEGSYKEIEEIVRVSENQAGELMAPTFSDYFYTQPFLPGQKFEEARKTPSNYSDLVNSQKFKNVISNWRHSRVAAVQLRMKAIERNLNATSLIDQYIKEN